MGGAGQKGLQNFQFCKCCKKYYKKELNVEKAIKHPTPFYVFQMPKFYSICSVWTSCEFFVSHCILRGLRRPLYLFFFLCISPSLPSLPLSLQPETLLPKTSFFPKRQTRLCRNPRIHRRPIIYSVEKNFAIRWDRTRVLSVQKRSC